MFAKNVCRFGTSPRPLALSLVRSKSTYFYEESSFDPLKSKFDERMHRIYGSAEAIHLSTSDQNRLMPEDNASAVLNKALDVEIYSMEKPSIIQPWEVLLQVDHTGICGSDLEYYKHGVIGPFELKQPMIMGHESGGTVLAVGNGVTNGLKPGDRVALEPGTPTLYVLLSCSVYCVALVSVQLISPSTLRLNMTTQCTQD